jgi:hypothetical protein
MKPHHGIPSQHGIKAMCSHKPGHEGRFGRLFPHLDPHYVNPCLLHEIGKCGGIMDAGGAKKKSNVPLGMVFLGQFIDHDITLDTTSRLDRNNSPQATRNFRTPALDLDCIYGQGPEASRYLYTEEMKLHIASTSTAFEYSGTAALKNELKKNDLSRNAEGRAIIGDFRNDENRMISQLQLTFIKFHNCVVDHLVKEKKSKYQQLNCKVPFKPNFAEIFEEAHKLVTWHYQWIVVNEFLPAMIGQELVDRILCDGRKFYRPRFKRPYIPIEFAAAAYRFGHSMVPGKFRVQKNGPLQLLFGPVMGSGFEPLKSKEAIIDWEIMFDCWKKYEKADALDTKLASILLDLPFIKEGISSLATRNLLRGQSFLIPSGETVAKHMEDCGINTQLPDVQNLLKKILKPIGYTMCTPLWFYILAEAEAIHNGDQMGPVGGRIVGETIIGLLESDPMSYLGEDRQWSPTLTDGKDCSFNICDLIRFCTT